MPKFRRLLYNSKTSHANRRFSCVLCATLRDLCETKTGGSTGSANHAESSAKNAKGFRVISAVIEPHSRQLLYNLISFMRTGLLLCASAPLRQYLFARKGSTAQSKTISFNNRRTTIVYQPPALLSAIQMLAVI